MAEQLFAPLRDPPAFRYRAEDGAANALTFPLKPLFSAQGRVHACSPSGEVAGGTQQADAMLIGPCVRYHQQPPAQAPGGRRRWLERHPQPSGASGPRGSPDNVPAATRSATSPQPSYAGHALVASQGSQVVRGALKSWGRQVATQHTQIDPASPGSAAMNGSRGSWRNGGWRKPGVQAQPQANRS